jgi:hypothetical protein
MNTLVNLFTLALAFAFAGAATYHEVQRCLNARKIARFLNHATHQQAIEMGYFDGSHGLRNKLDTFGDPITRAGYSEGYTQGQHGHTAAFRSCTRAYSEETN